MWTPCVWNTNLCPKVFKHVEHAQGEECKEVGCIEIRVLGVHYNKKPICVFLEKELRGLSPNFHIHVSVSDLYFPRISPHISWNRIGRPIPGTDKTLTDT